MHRFAAAAACFAISIAGSASSAQTIYPIDRAEILSGARFDFKIEFSGLADPAKIAVSLNGQDYAKAFGKTATFIEREDGKDQSALMLRDVSLTRPGSYKIHVTDGVQSREITWNVYGTAPRKAKNVILFIGDGMSPAHRVAARLLAKGIAEGKRWASSPSTTCRTWHWSPPPAAIPSLPIPQTPPAPMPPATNRRSMPWESTRTAHVTRSMIRKSRPLPAWSRVSSGCGRHRYQYRDRGCDPRRHGRPCAPAQRI
jgi:hypothetical protein